MAENIYHDILTVEKGKTNIYHDSLLIGIELELKDISNDIRTRAYWTLNDINNDIRTIPPQEELFDLDNDFRMYGTFAKIDINNDFRLADYADENIDNDFRMVGEIIRGDFINDFRTKKEEAIDINNKFSTVKVEAIDIDNKVNSCIEVVKEVGNLCIFVKQEIKDISSDIRTKKETRYEVSNDFRMLSPWQVPEAGEVGFQSAGKTEVKVYISSAEQTDIDVDSITISQILNGTSMASFNLGRPYDDTKPNTNSVVEIKYKGILLYKGYITEINPTDSPESIKINCQDEYWNLNKTKKYFFVGRKPADAQEYYYETIEQALNGLGFSYGVGGFIPQTIDLYGTGTADAISNLVQNSGNFSWFIKPDGSKILWQAGLGNIINLEPQSLGTNLGLYQVIRHSFRENITNIINRLKVQMGNWTIRKSSDDISKGTGVKTYTYIQNIKYEEWGIPAWSESLETLMKDSGDGWGYDRQDPQKDYKDVFRKFWIPEFRTGWYIVGNHTESLTDRYPPIIESYEGGGGTFIPWGYPSTRKYKGEGFSVDYGYKPAMGYSVNNIGRPSVSFSEPQAIFHTDENREVTRITRNLIKLHLWKELRWNYTVDDQTDPNQEPPEDIENPLMFYTNKMGSYPETITGDLNLSGLSKQDGFTVIDENGEIIDQVPYWDDTDFAKDYANWQLSKTCDKKILGSVNLTIDAAIFYGLDLSKRIKIDGIIDQINIKSISYNFNDFTVTLQLESERYYRRTEHYPYHGE